MNPSGVFATAGGRRFTLSMLVTVFSFASVWTGTISDSILRDIIIGIAGIFVGGNTVQKVAEIRAQKDGNE